MSRNHAPSSGEVILDGKAIGEYKPKEFARKLAVVHQQNEAPADITVEKLISFGRHIKIYSLRKQMKIEKRLSVH